jgi:hypothetical protein
MEAMQNTQEVALAGFSFKMEYIKKTPQFSCAIQFSTVSY